ncbi:MAG: pyridoxamine 5'-phosphate oxidase family protein [Tepidiformaceae bacterium]
MAELTTDDEILAEACRIAQGQPGGTLATMHAEDGTPYVTYVLFHLLANGRVLFGSGGGPQHTRNIAATPEVSFLIDNREAVKGDWNEFDRVVIEGMARRVAPEDAGYDDYITELASKSEEAAFFTKRGHMFCIEPRRLIMMKGLQPARHIVAFERADSRA